MIDKIDRMMLKYRNVACTFFSWIERKLYNCTNLIKVWLFVILVILFIIATFPCAILFGIRRNKVLELAELEYFQNNFTERRIDRMLDFVEKANWKRDGF